MRNLFVMAVAGSMCVLGGCSGVQKVGLLAIPESGFAVYDIRAEHGGSPSWSAGVIVNAAGEAVIVAPGTEGGLFGRLIGSGTSIGSAYLFGHSIRPDTYTDSSSTVVTSGSASGSESGASAGAEAGAEAGAGAVAGALAVNAPKTRITNNNRANGGEGGNGGNGGQGGGGGNGGSGGSDSNGHSGGHGQGNNPGHEHDDDD